MRYLHCRKLKAMAEAKAALRSLLGTLLSVGLLSANSAWALNSGDILTITPGTCSPSTTVHPPAAGQGSCFGMEVITGSILQTNIQGYNGIIIGTTQPADGSHSGAPNGSENPGIDQPWRFFSNTGMHLTTAPIVEITSNSVLDFSGWAVTWNLIPIINMGSGAHSGFTISQAQIVCNPISCSNGATYTLAYTATVPDGDPSNFGNVRYSLRLEGTVIVPGAAQSSPVGIAAGGVGGATTIRVNAAALTAAGIPVDSGFSNSGGYYDFVTPVAVLGGTTQVVLPLTSALPAGFVYRKYKNGSWTSFVSDADNNITSATVATGSPCPAPGNAAYGPATAGHNCLQLTITDGGPNDADGTPNSSVRDPGGVATAVSAPPGIGASGSSGCSLSSTPVNPLERGDWWLLLGFVAWMGFVARRKRVE